jgi:hypothetical protein
MDANKYMLKKTANDNNTNTGTLIGGVGLVGGVGAMAYGHNKINSVLPEDNKMSLFGKNGNVGTFNFTPSVLENKFNNYQNKIKKYQVVTNREAEYLDNAKKIVTGSKFMHYGKIGGLVGGSMMLGSMLSGNNN